MKKSFSMLMCVVMLISMFSFFGVTASAASPSDSLRIEASSFVDDMVTYNIYLKKNVSVNGAIIKILYDPDVLVPVFENDGAFMTKNSYGDSVQSVSGVYTSGNTYNADGVCTVAYVTMTPYSTGSSERGFMTVKFKAIHPDRPVTEVKFYCVEFSSPNAELNIPKSDTAPKGMYTHTTSTISRVKLVSVISAENGLRVSWKKAAGAASYRVFKLVNGKYAHITTVGAGVTSYDDTTVTAGQTATYSVRAVDKNNHLDSGFAGSISGTFVLAPGKVAVSIQPAGVKFGWTKVSGASSYRIYRREIYSDGSRSGWTYLYEAKSTATTYIDKTAPSGKQLEYTIRTYTSKGASAVCRFATIWYYQAPVFTLSAVTGGVNIKWSTIPGATKYNVYRKYNGAKSWTYIATVDAKTLSYLDTKAISGRNIDYTVRAFGANGSSTFTSKRIAYVGVPHLTSITNATNGITVKWNAVANATGYRVYRRAAGEKSWTYLGTTKNAYYTDKNVKSGVYYKYTVRTVFYSLFSNFESGLLIKCVATPKLTSIANVSGGVTVKWKTVGGANGYRVYRRGAGQTTWTYLGTVSGGTYTDKNVTKGQYYRYTVRATSGNVFSGFDSNGLVIKCS